MDMSGPSPVGYVEVGVVLAYGDLTQSCPAAGFDSLATPAEAFSEAHRWVPELHQAGVVNASLVQMCMDLEELLDNQARVAKDHPRSEYSSSFSYFWGSANDSLLPRSYVTLPSRCSLLSLIVV